MRPSSSWRARSRSNRGQSLRPAAAGLTTSTRRSTTRIADRPEATARDCSHARWRQDCEHHLGSRPVVLTVIAPPYHPQVRAASRRGCVAVSFGGVDPAARSGDTEALGGGCKPSALTRVGDRRDALRRLPMLTMVRIPVPADVTPMRHDETLGPGCVRCVLLDLVARQQGDAGVAIGLAPGRSPGESLSCPLGQGT